MATAASLHKGIDANANEHQRPKTKNVNGVDEAKPVEHERSSCNDREDSNDQGCVASTFIGHILPPVREQVFDGVPAPAPTVQRPIRSAVAATTALHPGK